MSSASEFPDCKNSLKFYKKIPAKGFKTFRLGEVKVFGINIVYFHYHIIIEVQKKHFQLLSASKQFIGKLVRVKFKKQYYVNV